MGDTNRELSELITQGKHPCTQPRVQHRQQVATGFSVHVQQDRTLHVPVSASSGVFTCLSVKRRPASLSTPLKTLAGLGLTLGL